MSQSFQVEVFNNTARAFNLQVRNVSMGSGSYETWNMKPQARLSQIFSGTPPFYVTGDGSTGAISLLVQFDITQDFQQVAGVEFDSTELINFQQGVMFYGSSGNISPGVPVPGTSNYLFATLFLGVGAGNQTLGTVVILEAVGASQALT
jgi:hypothetical protein